MTENRGTRPNVGRVTILVLPGGAYAEHAPYEGEPVAAWLRTLGYDSEVVYYPVLTRHPGPLDAVRAAIRQSRESGAHRVGLLGFSAGGHLAGHVALDRTTPDPDRPDFAVLCYPVVSMQGVTHEQSRRNLLGAHSTPEQRAETSLENLAGLDAPPLFLWHTANDEAVHWREHTLALSNALSEVGTSHELHLFPDGRHGLGLAEGHPAGAWTSLCASWLLEVATSNSADHL